MNRNTKKTLHLNLRRKWFDMILSGEKKEEYREFVPYWMTRFANIRNASEPTTTITFSHGYSKNRDQFVVRLKTIWIRKGRPEWGADVGKDYFVLEIGERVEKTD